MPPATSVAIAPAPAPAAPASLSPPTTPSATPPVDKLVWSYEFEGPAGSSPNPSKWGFDVGGGGWGNNELQYYTSSPQNASLDGHGDLVIDARAERYTGPDDVTRSYTSARLETLKTFQFTYGRMEASIQVPAGQGLLPAFWALGGEVNSGLDPWPACGEIDAMEVLGSDPNVLHGTLHGPWPALSNGIGGPSNRRRRCPPGSTSTAWSGLRRASASCSTVMSMRRSRRAIFPRARRGPSVIHSFSC